MSPDKVRPIVKGCMAITHGSSWPEFNNVILTVISYVGAHPSMTEDDLWLTDHEFDYRFYKGAMVPGWALLRIDDEGIQHEIESEESNKVVA